MATTVGAAIPYHRVIHVAVGTTRLVKMIAVRCQRPMTGARSVSTASSLYRVGPEYSTRTPPVAPSVGSRPGQTGQSLPRFIGKLEDRSS
jgi:hypothetical protein